jgi:membrane fusion protein, multidrug efflux system
LAFETEIHDTQHPRHPVRRTPSRLSRVFWVLVVLVLMGGILGGLWYFNEFRKGMIAKFLAGNVPPPVPVAVVEARLSNVDRTLTAIGSLQAVRQATVAPEVAGRVTRIHFESGARVKAGDPLVQLNDETEQASLLALKATSRLAEVSLERAVDLRRNAVGPQATVDQARSAYDEAIANIRKTEVAIAQKLVRAPFDGELGIRKVNLGEIQSPGAAIVTITDLSALYVNITLPEQEQSKVRLGQEIRVRVDAYPGRTFAGKVTSIDPQVAADSRTLKVQGTVENADRALLPGMFASAALVLPSAENQIVLPATAVDYSLYGDSVYVVKEEAVDGKPKTTANRISVKSGIRSGGDVVIDQGVKSGDKVIISGQVKLSNGAAVAITDDTRLQPPAKTPVY